MSDQAQIEGLHQRAAESYLQGQFTEALGSWRELLELDPQDERAIEGIRLCELIVQQEEESAFDAPDVATVAPAMDLTPLQPGEGSDVDFDEIQNLLKEDEAPDAAPASAEDPAWDLSAFGEAEPAGGGLDLADLPDLAAEASEAGVVDLGADFDIPGLDLGDSSDAPQASDAGNELEGRVAELLSQAATSYDAGDVEGALTLLDRVFILDEENASAKALAQAFQADIEVRDQPQVGDGPAPDAVADESLQSLGLADGAAGVIEDDAAMDLDEPLVDAPPEIGAPDGALDVLDDAPANAAVEAPVTGKRSLSLPRKPVLIGLGVVASLVAAGIVGFQLSRPSRAPADPIQARPVEAQPSAAVVVPAQEEPPVVAEPAAQQAAPEPAEDLASIRARARAAYDSGDFSGAVVAYNRALQLDANDRESRRGLAAAGAAYQEQREFIAKLDDATDAYANGEYRKALRLFYRLPGTEGVARFDRFKANGWFSLGVNALKRGACRDAKSHFAEAGALIPADPGVTQAAGLARTCSASQSNPAWQEEVQRLEIRRLED